MVWRGESGFFSLSGVFLLLMVLLVLGMEVVMPMNQASASGYDASAAVSYAKTYWSHYILSSIANNGVVCSAAKSGCKAIGFARTV